MARRPLRPLVGVVLAGVLGVAGCAAPAEDASGDQQGGSVDVPPGVQLSFLQQRREEGSSAARIRVANTSSSSLTVEGVGVDWPGYADAIGDFPYVVDPGETWDLPFTLSPPRCDASVADATPQAILLVDGRRLVGEMDQRGVEFLQRIWRAQCARLRLDAAVGLSYTDLGADHVSADGGTLRAGLLLTRRDGEEPIRITGNQGSVLFDLRVGAPQELAAGEEEARLPLDIRPTRCDEHALGQAAQPFFFRYFVAIADGESTYVIVEPDEAERERLLEFWHLACGDRTEDSID